eukprot:symbB.v1.2.020396.t1/scaffold1715.1/size104970/6
MHFFKVTEAYAVAKPRDMNSLQRELMQRGPVEVAFFVFSDFMNYRRGVYFRTPGAYGPLGGHAVRLLGWGIEEELTATLRLCLCSEDAIAVRTVYHKYHHPKECLITHGTLCRDLVRAANGERKKQEKENNDKLALNITKEDAEAVVVAKDDGGLEFVFPYGATLNAQKPAVPILSSGPISYPLNRPIAAVHSKAGMGRICVIGSVHMFGDDFLDCEKNRQVIDTLLRWLMKLSDCELSYGYGEEPELSEYHHIPHTQGLAMNLRSCLQENEPLPRDFTQLFDDSLFKFDTDLIPEAFREGGR